MTKIYLDFDKSTKTLSEGDDQWDAGETSSTWVFNSVSLSKDPFRWQESYELEYDTSAGEIIWVVIPVWSTGSSFGYDIADCMEIMGGFRTKEEAEARAAELRELREPDYSKDHNKWLPWHGYFEDLCYIEVKEFIIEP